MRSLPPTAEAKSASGGKHIFYRLPTGLRAIPRPLDCKKIKHFLTLDKIDVKGSGGLVVGAGSLNKAGQPYEWVIEPGVVAEITPAPDWMLDELCGSEKGEYLIQFTGDMIHDPFSDLVHGLCARFPIAPGTRNEQTARAAGWLLGRGLAQEKAQEAGKAWLNTQGREDEDSHNDLLRALSKLYDRLAAGDEAVYLMTDHEQRAVDYWKNKRDDRTLNRFSVLPHKDITENDQLFLTALDCFITYETGHEDKNLHSLPMTYEQLRKVYRLLHGKALPIDSLYKMLDRFVTREGKKAQKVEMMVQEEVGRLGKPSVYRVSGGDR